MNKTAAHNKQRNIKSNYFMNIHQLVTRLSVAHRIPCELRFLDAGKFVVPFYSLPSPRE